LKLHMEQRMTGHTNELDINIEHSKNLHITVNRIIRLVGNSNRLGEDLLPCRSKYSVSK